MLQKHRLRLNAENFFFGVGLANFWVLDHQPGDRSQSWLDRGREASPTAEQPERITGVDRDASRSQPVHLKIFRSLPSILSAFEEVEGILVGCCM